MVYNVIWQDLKYQKVICIKIKKGRGFMDIDIFSVKNQLMENIFPELITYINSNSDVQWEIPNLLEVLLSKFIIHQGCYLLECALPPDFSPKPEQAFIPKYPFPDRTGYECYQNHLHTSDILKDSDKGLQNLLTGIIIADNLRYKLKSAFPSHRFRIFLSYNVLPIFADEPEIMNECVVRFHSVRDGEYIYNNLDDFKFEAMGLVEV
jgi:hypothetical protein